MKLEKLTDNEDAARNITTLARQLDLPEQQVSIVYHRTLGELAATARIRSYLGILAMSTTRTILNHQATVRSVH